MTSQMNLEQVQFDYRIFRIDFIGSIELDFTYGIETFILTTMLGEVITYQQNKTGYEHIRDYYYQVSKLIRSAV